MKPIDPSKRIKLLQWGVSVVLAGFLTLAIDSIVPTFWGSKILIKLPVLLASFILFSALMKLWLGYLHRQVKTINVLHLALILLGALLISVILTIWGPSLVVIVPAATFGGRGHIIERLINGSIAIILQPFFIISFTAAIYGSLRKGKTISTSGNTAKLYHQLFIALCLGALILPWFGVTDFRNIQEAFLGRDWLIRSISAINVFLHDKVFDSSMIGRDNWLIYTGAPSMDDYQNTLPFSDQDLARIQSKLDSLSDRLVKKGVKALVVVVAPNKNTIYPEYFPPEITKIGPESRLDQLINYEKQHGKVKVLDIRPTLLAAKRQSLVYYRTDSHWNPLGAFIAYQAVMAQLQRAFPNLKTHTLTDFRIVPTKKMGDISTNMIKSNFTEDTFEMVPLFSRKVFTQSWRSHPSDNRFNLITANPDSTLPKLVMFEDSFSEALIPYLADHFSRGVYLWAYPSDESFYDIEKPDVVIIEITERLLAGLKLIPDN